MPPSAFRGPERRLSPVNFRGDGAPRAAVRRAGSGAGRPPTGVPGRPSGACSESMPVGPDRPLTVRLPAAEGRSYTRPVTSNAPAPGFLSIGQAIVGFLRSADTVNAIGRLLYIPLFALGILGNVSVFGSTLETIARWSPGGALISMLAGAMAPATWNSGNWWSVLVSLAYSLVFVALGIRWFQWETR